MGSDFQSQGNCLGLTSIAAECVFTDKNAAETVKSFVSSNKFLDSYLHKKGEFEV